MNTDASARRLGMLLPFSIELIFLGSKTMFPVNVATFTEYFPGHFMRLYLIGPILTVRRIRH